MVTFESGQERRDDIGALLMAAELPHEDIDAHLGDFIVAVDGGHLVGVVGLERVSDGVGLLQSLAVTPDRRGTGVGILLCNALVKDARRLGLHKLYLLTTTAAPFFARRGFAKIERADVGRALERTREWSELCPSTATVMALRLE